MKPDDKFSWLLRQTGNVSEMSLLQTCVIACSHRETTIDGRVFPPFHVWLSAAEIAHRSGLNERTIPAVSARLIRRGLIESAGRFGKTAQIRVYRLLIDAAESPKEPASLEKHESPQDSAPLPQGETPQDAAPLDVTESLQVPASKDCMFLHESLQVPASAYIEKRRESKREVKREKTRASKPRDLVAEFPDYLTGVDSQVLHDWAALRKQKRAPITTTVLASISSEATKAGMSMTAALTMMCARNWQGFRAEWCTGGDRQSAPSKRGVASVWAANRQEALEAENRAVVARALARDSQPAGPHMGSKNHDR